MTEEEAVKEMQDQIKNMNKEISDLQKKKERMIRESHERMDKSKLKNRPQYPTDDMIAGVSRIRNMTIEEYDDIPHFTERIEFSPDMSFIPFSHASGKPMVEITANAPRSEATGLKLWGFESLDVTRIISAFESRGVRVQQTQVSPDKQTLLFAIETPWLQ